MKKFLFVMMAFALCLVSCKNNKNEETQNDSISEDFPGYYSFEHIINQDLQEFMVDSTLFLESQIRLDKNVCEENAKIIWIMNVFQNGDTCIMVTHDKKGVKTINKVEDHWLEDMTINYDSVLLTMNAAIEKLDQLNIKVESNMCVLRRPLTRDFYTDAFYIFGDQHFGKFYAVNGKNGEILEMSDYIVISPLTPIPVLNSVEE